MVIVLVTTTGLRVSALAALNVGDFYGGSKRPYLSARSVKKRKRLREQVPQ